MKLFPHFYHTHALVFKFMACPYLASVTQNWQIQVSPASPTSSSTPRYLRHQFVHASLFSWEMRSPPSRTGHSQRRHAIKRPSIRSVICSNQKNQQASRRSACVVWKKGVLLFAVCLLFCSWEKRTPGGPRAFSGVKIFSMRSQRGRGEEFFTKCAACREVYT